QVAQVALDHHLDVIPLGDPVHLQGVGFVHQVEQGGKGVAQAHAAAAAVADVKDTLQLPVEGLLVVEVRTAPVDGVAGGGVETAFSHGTYPPWALGAALLWRWMRRAPWPRGHGGVWLRRRVGPAPSGSGWRGCARPWRGFRTSRQSRRSPRPGRFSPCRGTCRCTRGSRRRWRP